MAKKGRTAKGKPGRIEPPPLDQGISDAQADIFFRHLEEAFEPSVVDAAKLARFTKAQFNEKLRTDMGFAARFKRWEENRMESLEERAHQVAMKGDPSMIKFILSKKRSEEWGDGKKGQVNLNLTPADLAKMSDEELAELKRRCSE